MAKTLARWYLQRDSDRPTVPPRMRTVASGIFGRTSRLIRKSFCRYSKLGKQAQANAINSNDVAIKQKKHMNIDSACIPQARKNKSTRPFTSRQAGLGLFHSSWIDSLFNESDEQRTLPQQRHQTAVCADFLTPAWPERGGETGFKVKSLLWSGLFVQMHINRRKEDALPPGRRQQ
ncbi:unnamed protein product [Protopolystoma xenopodis]|uniref:Uncharacterized protein n=1 Tax=Protopolystoma xenopodis TaxID=117903 RepID=A0A3S5CJC4_9PLAT|nr:unnamed protein product [Protopolystoma xenopodis]